MFKVGDTVKDIYSQNTATVVETDELVIRVKWHAARTEGRVFWPSSEFELLEDSQALKEAIALCEANGFRVVADCQGDGRYV